jgi:hypothetical protein
MMRLRPTPDLRRLDATRRARLAAPAAPGDADRAPLAAAAPRPSSRATSLLAAAELDQRLATALLRLPPDQRQAAIRTDPRFRRLTLAQLFALRAEDTLHQPSAEPLETAELAASIASELIFDGGGYGPAAGKAGETAALAHWLLGKALLAKRRWRLAEESFRCVVSFLPDRVPNEHRALAHAGLAQVQADLHRLDAAAPLYLSAARHFSRLDAARPAAACLSELGLALHDTGDLRNAAHVLRRALGLLGNPAFAPSLACRLHLALAEVAATLGRAASLGRHLGQARRLYRLSSSLPEDIERTWRQARIAAAAGQATAADHLFDRARQALLAHGSLAEATRCTLDHLLLWIDGDRLDSAPDLTAALAQSFQPAGHAWAADLAALVALAAGDRTRLYAAAHQLRQRLRHAPPASSGRPPLLTPVRVLTDRLLRCRGDHEDPIGAASGL